MKKITNRYYTRRAYFEEIIQFANHAKKGDKIIIATMSLKPKYSLVQDIMTSLTRAAANGAKVVFLVDSYAFMMPEGGLPGPLLYGSSIHSRSAPSFSKKSALLDDITKAGGQVIVLNKPPRPLSIPVAGRSHIKFAILNDDVFIGGCNLTNPNQIDLMVRRRSDTELVKILTRLTTKISQAPNNNVAMALQFTDLQKTLKDGTELLIDAGVSYQSIISAKASSLLKGNPKNVLYACQYPAYGLRGKQLRQLYNQGSSVEIFTNHFSQLGLPQKAIFLGSLLRLKMNLALVLKMSRKRTQNSNYIHAKVLIADSNSIVGSHNLVSSGVRLGTAELALYCAHEQCSKDIRSHIYSQFADKIA